MLCIRFSLLLFLSASLVWSADPIEKVYAGYAHTCILSQQGNLKCWGYNEYGVLLKGNNRAIGGQPGEMGAALPIMNLGTGVKVKQVSIERSEGVTCVLTTDSKIKCWGNNSNGVLGLGAVGNVGDQAGEVGDAIPFLSFTGNPKPVSISVGSSFACALFDTGKVRCWGNSNFGQLGVGTTVAVNQASLAKDIDFGTTDPVVQVSTGHSHACAVFSSKKVKCWGLNSNGQLGLNNTTNVGGATTLADISYVALGVSVRKMHLGEYHSCAELESGDVLCWGLNNVGQLGLGDNQNRGNKAGDVPGTLRPLRLGTSEKIKQFVVGRIYNCALFESGRAKCWGSNAFGELGLGNARLSVGTTPADINDLPWVNLVSGGLEVEQMSAGFYNVCALIKPVNAMKCWGENNLGSLGLEDQQRRGNLESDMGVNLPYVRARF